MSRILLNRHSKGKKIERIGKYTNGKWNQIKETKFFIFGPKSELFCFTSLEIDIIESNKRKKTRENFVFLIYKFGDERKREIV